MHLAMVAGELSGDALGAGLVQELQQSRHIRAEGIGGSALMALGFASRHDLEVLSVMGILEPLRRLPRLLAIRHQLKRHWLRNPPDVFIGVDSPSFNLGLARRLHSAGTKAVQYVSPQVWAWRRGRIPRIAESVDLVLCLLPFEPQLYASSGVRALFVGHPLADQIAPEGGDKLAVRANLGVSGSPWVALLPGSRRQEVRMIAPKLFAAAAEISVLHRDAVFLVPSASPQCHEQLLEIQRGYPDIALRLVPQQAHEVLRAADVAVVTSGTAALEAALLRCPHLVVYDSGWVNRMLMRLTYVSEYSLPNLIAGRHLVTELLMDEMTVSRIVSTTLGLLESENIPMLEGFAEIHRQLRCGTNQRAAEAVLELVRA